MFEKGYQFATISSEAGIMNNAAKQIIAQVKSGQSKSDAGGLY